MIHLRPVPRKYSFALEQARSRIKQELQSDKAERDMDRKMPRHWADRQSYLRNGGV